MNHGIVLISFSFPAFAALRSSEHADPSDDEESFESCEQDKHSSSDSPRQPGIQDSAESLPSTIPVADFSRLRVETSGPLASLTDALACAQNDSEASSLAATPSPAAIHVAPESLDPESLSPSGSNSTSESAAREPVSADAEDSALAARAADATDGTDDVDQGQIFDFFDLKIVYERGRTGFEDTKEIEFLPGMLIAVCVHFCIACHHCTSDSF
jgi:hypothetical protein